MQESIETLLRRFLAPPVFDGEDEKTRTAYLFNAIALSLIPLLVMVEIVAALFIYQGFDIRIGIMFLMTLALLGLLAMMRAGHVQASPS